MCDLWFETGSTSIVMRRTVEQNFPKIIKVLLQHQHLLHVCPVLMEVTVSVEDNQNRQMVLFVIL